MTGLLGWLVQGVELTGAYVLWALETFGNLLLAAVVAAYAAVIALPPGMSDAPAIGHPTWLSWLNWFFPVGALLTILTGALALWLGWLAVRYVLRLVRGI